MRSHLLLLLLVGLLFATTPCTAATVDASSSRAAATANATNSSATVITVSFCELCRDQHKCDQAYHGLPGIACPSGRVACCCPADGVCLRAASSASSYDCACGDGRKAQDARVKDQQADEETGDGGGFGAHKIAWTVAGALLLCVAVAMYLYSTRGYHYRGPPSITRPHPPRRVA